MTIVTQENDLINYDAIKLVSNSDDGEEEEKEVYTLLAFDNNCEVGVKRAIALRQYEKLDRDHIHYILDSIAEEARKKKIKNLRPYLKKFNYGASEDDEG